MAGLRCLFLISSFLIVIHSAVLGQTQVEGRQTMGFFGVAFGGGDFPGPLQPECNFGYADNTPAASAEIRGGATVGRLRLETRTSVYTSMVWEECLFLPPSFIEGTHTVDRPIVDGDGFALTDVRVGYSMQGGILYWLVSGGVGWAWRADVPVVLLSTGVGVGRGIRLALDADWVNFRIPWYRIEEEWHEGQLVRELSRSRWHNWRSGFLVRLGLEMRAFN